VLNWLWRQWMSVQHPFICWKHREEMTSNYSGSFCRSCDQERWAMREAKENSLRERYGVVPTRRPEFPVKPCTDEASSGVE
jgi:hypothetical protein